MKNWKDVEQAVTRLSENLAEQEKARSENSRLFQAKTAVNIAKKLKMKDVFTMSEKQEIDSDAERQKIEIDTKLEAVNTKLIALSADEKCLREAITEFVRNCVEAQELKAELDKPRSNWKHALPDELKRVFNDGVVIYSYKKVSGIGQGHGLFESPPRKEIIEICFPEEAEKDEFSVKGTEYYT